ncbi:hypothetical protein [Kitasatospora sp. NPDC058478]|uniref:hypothetical protein n=1 Tax=unclassified Kitasatospora TaxID=2633591 RepID=UPI003647297E
MSTHREGIAWQREDGTWSIGYYGFTRLSALEDGDPDDCDDEWDIEYHYDSFWFLSTGHPTYESAFAAYTRTEANPGVEPDGLTWAKPEGRDEVARLDAIAADYLAREAELAAYFQFWK